MIKIKLHTLFSIYLLGIALLYQYFIDIFIEDNYIFLGIICFSELILFIIIIIRLFKKGIISYSLLLNQFLIIIVSLYAFEVNFYLFISLTLILYYALFKLHKKELSRSTYRLHIVNNTLLTIVYLAYGLINYGLFYLSNEIPEDALELIYYAFYPYLIIITILFCIKFDPKIDQLKTDLIYQENIRKIYKRNLLINILSIILFLIK